MNHPVTQIEDTDLSFSVSFRNAQGPEMARGSQKDKAFGRRRGKAPQQFNGIHRRRVKKIRW